MSFEFASFSVEWKLAGFNSSIIHKKTPDLTLGRLIGEISNVDGHVNLLCKLALNLKLLGAFIALYPHPLWLHPRLA